MHSSKQGRFVLDGRPMHTEQRKHSIPMSGNNWVVPGEFPTSVDRRRAVAANAEDRTPDVNGVRRKLKVLAQR